MTAPPREPVAWMTTLDMGKGGRGPIFTTSAEIAEKWREAGEVAPLYAAPAPPVAQPAEPINAAAAVYMLLGELTSSYKVPPLGATSDAAPWAEIANKFCDKYGLGEPHGGPYDAAPAPPVAQPAEPPAQDDLVRRLREMWPESLGNEAADLIERQAREIADLQANFDGLDAASTNERRMTFTWRQRAERAEALAALRLEWYAKACAERDALRELLREVLHATSGNMSMDMYAKVCDALGAARAKVKP